MPEPTTPIPDEFRTADEYRQDLEGLGERLNGLREVDTSDRDANWDRDVRGTTREINQLDLELRAVETFHQLTILERLERVAGMAVRGGDDNGPIAALDSLAGEHRSAGQIFTDSDAYQNRRGPTTDSVEVRTLLTTSTSDPGAGLWMPVGQPIPPRPRQARLFVRDLLSVQGTQLNSIPYIQELNPATNESGASSVSEGGLKPEVTMQFTSADAPTRKIAGWLPVTTEIVEDAPTLRGYIDTRLVYMLLLREEQQVLNGSGVAPQLQGIRTHGSVQTQSFATDVPNTVGQAIGKVELVDGEPDGLVWYPADFWSAWTTRYDAQLDFGHAGNLPAGAPPNTYLGLRVIRTRSATSGEVIVGSWALGATLFERSAPSVRTLDQHSDYAIYNKLVVLAEERVALAIHRPDFFVLADITA